MESTYNWNPKVDARMSNANAYSTLGWMSSLGYFSSPTDCQLAGSKSDSSSFWREGLDLLELTSTVNNLLTSYCWCEPSELIIEEPDSQGEVDKILASKNFETYKQVKALARQTNPELTKEEIYEMMLKPFQHEKVKVWDNQLQRYKISYVCRYNDCGKEFTKTWNLLDHVRMHEGIKPYACEL
eukprot:CAMPEP_0168347456 /NCGR_PEP_ID=MMETSP0213-20121227/19013_1 /TAXON_ID=151035 /ORGANISM="Euplotes harpa, Strain FSP1.4" /LENGTH=183 /DNA_ID=CAMNT_0008356573 /DNA_START=44 /DNA_END=595 /DNA_ORIENTATION=+